MIHPQVAGLPPLPVDDSSRSSTACAGQNVPLTRDDGELSTIHNRYYCYSVFFKI